MPPERAWALRIEDILDSIARIGLYTESMEFEEFTQDERTVDAVIRHFGIIGEAANHVPEAVRVAHPELPWEAMRAMRNFVVHEYFGVSREVLCRTLQDDLPGLVPALQTLLMEGPEKAL